MLKTETSLGNDPPKGRDLPVVGELPVCTVTASSTLVAPNGISILTATCKPAAASYVWEWASETPSIPSTGCENKSGDAPDNCTATPPVTTNYTVRGVNSAGTGMPSQALKVVVNPALDPIYQKMCSDVKQIFASLTVGGPAVQWGGGELSRYNEWTVGVEKMKAYFNQSSSLREMAKDYFIREKWSKEYPGVNLDEAPTSCKPGSSWFTHSMCLDFNAYFNDSTLFPMGGIIPYFSWSGSTLKKVIYNGVVSGEISYATSSSYGGSGFDYKYAAEHSLYLKQQWEKDYPTAVLDYYPNCNF